MSSLHLLPGATTTLNSAFLLHPHSPLFPSKTLTPKKPKPPSALLQWNCKPKPQPKPFCRTYWCTLGIKKSQEFAFIISLNLEARNCSILLKLLLQQVRHRTLESIFFFLLGNKIMPDILSRLNATIYCRIREAITRQQGVPTSLYRSSALPLCSLTSSHTLHTKSMITASHSNAMLGDVYAYGLISGRGSVRDFTKPAVGCLRGSVNLRRLQPLYGPLSFGCSTFDANRRIRDSSLLHGSWLKNFSASSSACYSAGAAHAVSFDGSPPDEQLANSSFSPDPYVIVVLNILNSISP
ncbi:hypothetical protein HKD37_07G019508 [Glycine soja]